jgi:hypothetical protein
MGGRGPGHKSERAQAARRINIQKARAARRREPLPWRSGVESRVIEQLVWQWWMEKKEAASARESGGERMIAITPQRRPFVPRSGRFIRQGGRMMRGPWIAMVASEKAGASKVAGGTARKTPGPWAALRLARVLGVSHTWVNKLVKRFEADPERARKRNGAFAPATLETLKQAREETRWQREHGRLRGLMPRRKTKDKVFPTQGFSARR